MGSAIEELEKRRGALFEALAQIGDLRRGSISEAYRRCGKPSCACTAADHPGHGPFYAFTRKEAGKTKTIQLREGPRLAKLEREVGAYHEFQATCEKLVDVNEAICEARPVEPVEAVARRGRKKEVPRSSKRRWRRRSSG
jgi:hypothetical protein